ncbi:MAG: hypothetical protein LH485_08735 [Sphingomonas bacterium]|nr:hypothetical protein [Sphingomonas bacterium]
MVKRTESEMGPVGYFIAILGCADGGASCQTVATLAPRYENAAQCAGARDSALDANSDLDFPTLIAQCQKASLRPAAVRDTVRPSGNAKAA